MNHSIKVKQRFQGPDGMGNGGYVCGQLAKFLSGTTEVTLFKPTPLDQILTIQSSGNTAILKYNDDKLAMAKPGLIQLNPPGRIPSYQEAISLSKNYSGFQEHPYPYCFVCGPKRNQLDALCIFPGWTDEGDMVVAPWVPGENLSNEKGYVKKEFIWAALDCPGGIAVLEETPDILLGRLTVRIDQEISHDEKCTVIGWLEKKEGRKYFTGTAIYTQAKGLCAIGKAVWIALR